MKSIACTFVVLILSSLALAGDPDTAQFVGNAKQNRGKVKVFILAGQDNMEGSGNPEALAWQVSQPEYRERWTRFIKNGDYDAFVDAAGKISRRRNYLWSERDDVWVNFRKRRGKLTVGYGGVPNGFGPEFTFGQVVGDHFEEQVLIIKVAWRGRALGKEFLPPSSMPSDEEFAQIVETKNVVIRRSNEEGPARTEEYNKKIIERNKTRDRKTPILEFKPRPLIKVDDFKKPYGKDYIAMIQEVKTCLSWLKERFPGYQEQGYELSGFVWFHGWNDAGAELSKTYEQNLANLIRDVRKDLHTSNLPFIIGQMGQRGQTKSFADKQTKSQLVVMKAQEAVPNFPEFKGNVLCVKTSDFLDADAHRIYFANGGWRKNKIEWEHFGKDMPSRYYGSPWSFSQIGTAFGQGMLQLMSAMK